MSNDDLQIIESEDGLTADVRTMISQTREGVAQVVNQGMTLLYWRIGSRIQTEVLGNERAEYGGEIMPTLVGTVDGALWQRLLHEKPSSFDDLFLTRLRLQKLPLHCRGN